MFKYVVYYMKKGVKHSQVCINQTERDGCIQELKKQGYVCWWAVQRPNLEAIMGGA